jgi:hypothetical protein
MKQSWIWGILPVAVLLAVFALFYALFSDRLVSDGMLFSTISLLSLALGAASYALVRGFLEGWNGTTGFAAALSVIILLLSGGGLALQMNGIHSGAMITGVLIVVCFAVLLVVNGMDEISFGKRNSSNTSGNPSIWADRLEAIGRRCARPELRTKVLRLGGETRFLSNGDGMSNPLINQGISKAIEELSEVVKLGDDSSALSMLSGIRSLFAQRENQLKP